MKTRADRKWFLLAPGQWENDQGPDDWWAIAHDDWGIVAYAMDEDRAQRVVAALDDDA